MNAPLLLYDRSGVIAIAKPAGLATQAPPGIESVESWLRQLLHGPEVVESREAGWPGPETVEWRDLVEKVPEEARARIVMAGGREAVTRARLVARLPAAGDRHRLLLALEPLTGRMHQLRLQAAARGLPIVGDVLYDAAADRRWSNAAAAGLPEPPIALHAARIRYLDPDTGEPVVAAAPLPGYWPAEAGLAAGG